MSDAALDDPGLLEWREKFWTAALTNPRYPRNIIAVATSEGSPIGISMSGPSSEDSGGDARQRYVLYAYEAFHGSGVGTALLDAVVEPTSSTMLWVADPNPRAQAFYRKHSFIADGPEKTEDGVREIHMMRAASSSDVASSRG